MLSTFTGDKKNKMLETMIEEWKMGDDDTNKKNLHSLLFNSASEHDSIKNKWTKIITPHDNEVHSDVEEIAQEGDE